MIRNKIQLNHIEPLQSKTKLRKGFSVPYKGKRYYFAKIFNKMIEKMIEISVEI